MLRRAWALVNNGWGVLWGCRMPYVNCTRYARSAGGCERWSRDLRRSGASSSTARRDRLGYWVGRRLHCDMPGCRAEVARVFEGLDLMEPGLVRVQGWRPGTEAGATSPAALWRGQNARPSVRAAPGPLRSGMQRAGTHGG